MFVLNASPFITRTIQNHLEKHATKQQEDKVLVGEIKNSLYVDDSYTGEFEKKAAFQFYKNAKGYHEERTI